MKYDYGNVEYEGDDFYCYPDTKVLMNRFNIKHYMPFMRLFDEKLSAGK
jgi:hypothetical protein